MGVRPINIGEPAIAWCPTCMLSSCLTGAVDIVDDVTFELVMKVSMTVCMDGCGYRETIPRTDDEPGEPT